MAQSKLKAMTMLTFDTADLTADFEPIGTLTVPCSILRIINNSTAIIAISYDGTHAHDYILATSSITLEAQTNKSPNGDVCQFAAGTTIYASTGAEEAGELVIAGYYQST